MTGNKGFDPTFPQHHGPQAAQKQSDQAQNTLQTELPMNEQRPEATQPQGMRQGDGPGHGPSENHQGNPNSTRASNVRGRSGSDSRGGKK